MKKDEKDSEDPKDSGKESKGSDKPATNSKKESKESKQEGKKSEKDSNEPGSTAHEKKSEKEDSKKEPNNSKIPPLKLSENDSTKRPVKSLQDSLEALLKHVGDMGRYQKILLGFMFPFGVFFAFVYFVQMFITVTPQNHWCYVPELAHLDMEVRRNLSLPGAATGKLDQCRTFDVNWTQVVKTLTPPAPGTPTVPCRNGWDFEFKDIPYATVVSERGWVCDKAGNVPLAQAIFFIGAFLGGLVFGFLADRFGRLPALMLANMVGGVGGIATIYSTGMWDFTMCRFIVGIAFDNMFMMPLILVLEYVGPSYRTWVANLSITFFGVGLLLLPGLALLLKDWRMLLWVTSLPLLLAVFSSLVFPESARWFLSRGEVNKAVEVLRKFERINRTRIPDDVMDDFIVSANRTTRPDESLMILLTSVPLRVTMILMLIVYMTSSVVFDVLVRMSESFGLDFFITFAVTSSTEIPSVLLLASLLDIWGRRLLTAVPMVLTALCTFVAMFVPIGIPQASLAVIARFCINMSYNAVVLWTTELLPTSVRASGSATMHMSGYVASVLSPYIVYSERYWQVLPLLVLSVVSLVSSFISMVLPETKGRPMPQTIADGEKIVKDRPTWRLRASRPAPAS